MNVLPITSDTFKDGDMHSVTTTSTRLGCIPSHIFIYARPMLGNTNTIFIVVMLAIFFLIRIEKLERDSANNKDFGEFFFIDILQTVFYLYFRTLDKKMYNH